MAVGVGVFVGVLVGVAVGVLLDVVVGVLVAVGVAVGVSVGVLVGASVAVSVGAGVSEAVGVGVLVDFLLGGLPGPTAKVKAQRGWKWDGRDLGYRLPKFYSNIHPRMSPKPHHRSSL